MKKVPFWKFTSFGNNFVIVDESRGPILTETEKSNFAYKATSIHFGVGSDNFLVIQSCNPENLRAINQARGYWDEVPASNSSNYIFRMFEPDGKEAFSCGNGLMCTAKYLYCRYGVQSANIMTEVPTAWPKDTSIGTHIENGKSWANMGYPRRIPPEMVDPKATFPYDDIIDTVEDIQIPFREHDLEPFSDKKSLQIRGSLVFTGEPHMVVFCDTGFSLAELPKMLFVSSYQDSGKIQRVEKRVAFGSWLIDHIGNYVNKHYAHIFPAGININFARVNQRDDFIEYRCFERGINHETLACGTGALAVSCVARRHNLLNTKQITLWPHRCRWDHPDAEILVQEKENGWVLHGNPEILFGGIFMYQTPAVAEEDGIEFFQPAVENMLPPVLDYNAGRAR